MNNITRLIINYILSYLYLYNMNNKIFGDQGGVNCYKALN